MNVSQALDLIKQSVNSLTQSGLIETAFETTSDTVLLGTGAALDSISLITLLSDVEEKVSAQSGKEVFLVLNEVHDFNEDKQNLTVDTLARYIEKITA